MDRITDAFVWPFRDSEWLPKIVIIGLILLIPIAGVINDLGWMLAAIDRLRAGEERLPPANLSYLGRGVRLFIVILVYGLLIAAAIVVLLIPSVLLSNATGTYTSNLAVIAIVLMLNVLVFSVGSLGSLALNFAMPAIVLATDHSGIAGGLNVVRIVRRIRASATNTLIAGLMLIAVGIVGQLGIAACVIGFLFTSAYSLAMQAWIIRSYELGAASTATAT